VDQHAINVYIGEYEIYSDRMI